MQVFGNEHDAAGESVQSMHDTGSLRITGFQRAHMMQQCIHKRPGSDAGSGMADHSGRLVDYGNFGILVKNMERDFFGERLLGWGFGRKELDAIIQAKQVAGLDLLAVYTKIAFSDPVLNLRPALSGYPAD